MKENINKLDGKLSTSSWQKVSNHLHLRPLNMSKCLAVSIS